MSKRLFNRPFESILYTDNFPAVEIKANMEIASAPEFGSTTVACMVAISLFNVNSMLFDESLKLLAVISLNTDVFCFKTCLF